nr:hypothetical protein [Bradyrhizobium brasilense]
MTDIGDPSVALMMNGRLLGAAGLQIVGSNQPHVGGFRRIADLLLGARTIREQDKNQRAANCRNATAHAHHPMFHTNLRWLPARLARRCRCQNTRS